MAPGTGLWVFVSVVILWASADLSWWLFTGLLTGCTVVNLTALSRQQKLQREVDGIDNLLKTLRKGTRREGDE